MQILSETRIAGTSWLSLMERRYLDREGRERLWSYTERTDARPAVLVIAETVTTGRVVLLRQYRVPLGAYALEFPAGLADDNESAAETAYRELLEESGFEGSIRDISPALCTSPGLTGELIVIARMEVQEQPEHPPLHEASEEIEVLVLSVDELCALIEESKNTQLVIDSRVYAWYLARKQGSVNEL
ncbi:MAG: NUDIX hydrolase [Spirochaetota bacterium]|jgi:ADP-ribose pyrophosphatase|nr:NUDIX hydrolase [Spirochaetota bacterium]